MTAVRRVTRIEPQFPLESSWPTDMLPVVLGSVAELADALDLGSSTVRCAGSIPVTPTIGNEGPFGEYIEGLSYCGEKSYVIESAVHF